MKSVPKATIMTALAAPALAQTAVDGVNKFAWSENCGWMNWADAGSPAGSQGVGIDGSGRFLSGFIWCENIGWINLGDGSPANGAAYANTAGADFGVNVDVATGDLSGLAWGENVGWINFSGGAVAGGAATAARLSMDSPRRFHGYAWGENIGWINLDVVETGKHVAFKAGSGCDSIDWNNDGLFPDNLDLVDFLAVFGGGACSNDPNCGDLDFNNDGLFPDNEDILAFFRVFGGGPC
ncbi:MAG TPA: hypothetical protein VD971_07405 [Phycisphaerales bacterium]|nr:hypothetical protein [Phycisphaerales bacterium]